jgi:replication factor A1
MPKRFWKYHGKGRYSEGSDKDIKTLKYLASIAVKYDIDSNDLLYCIQESLDEGESKYKRLNVKCRQKRKDSAIILLTVGSDVVGQFPISNGIFQGEKLLESFITTIKSKKFRTKKIVNPKIEDLRAGMKKIHLKAKVIEIPEPNIVYTRFGSSACVSNILISDKTGSIRLSVWNRQINSISKGNIIEVENGKVASYKGELQLRIGRKGYLNVIT